MQSISENGDLVFTIGGDLPKKSYRGEGRYVVDLNQTSCVIEKNAAYFSSGFDLSNGRGLLAALFMFHPTWNAVGSYKEMIHMGFEPSESITTVETNLSCPPEMLEILKNDWMLPNLRFSFVTDSQPTESGVNTPEKKPSLAFGGGLDSGAAICLLKDNVDSYYITNSSPCNVREGIEQILDRFSGHIIHTNVKSLYSVTGFPHWMIPYVPSMLRGDRHCLTGSILESQYLRDGLGYNNSSGNLWIKMLQMAGVEALPLSCHSEYTNAFIVAESGLTEQIAGNCTDEWGYGYKALRKAVLMRPFHEAYESVLLELEERGFVIEPKIKFSQPSKMLTSTSRAALSTESSSASKSINNLRKFGPHSELPWAFKYHPDNFSNSSWPDDLLRILNQSQDSLGIQPMNTNDLLLLQEYEHGKFLKENYPESFLTTL